MIKIKNLVFVLLVVSFVAVFLYITSLRETDVRQPIELNDTIGTKNFSDDPGISNVKKFSDAPKNRKSNNINNRSSGAKPVVTPKPLPYPRISINYSMETTTSIGSSTIDKNNTLIIVKLDIRNYGYKYFDAHPSRFRMGRSGQLVPLVNITTGNLLDDVVPNNSRAKGDLVFLLSRRVNAGKLTYLSNIENYEILYRRVSPSEIEEKKQVIISGNEEDI